MNFIFEIFDGINIDRVVSSEESLKHGELIISDSMIIIAEESKEASPNQSMLHIYYDDVNVTYQKALAKGAKSLMEPTDQCMVT